MNLKTIWQQAQEKSFLGWDFSYLDNKWQEEPLPWDYKTLVKQYLMPNSKLLDMGTGGGEFLLSLNHPYHLTTVTEAYEPNLSLCKEKLAPLGISVNQVICENNLPFDQKTFDIIINRHESYNINEIRRILKPGGIFITQQVGGKNNESLSKRLINDYTPLYLNHNLKNALDELSDFTLLYSNEYFPYLRFYDVSAIVYFAKIISWEFPNFSVDNCFENLLTLQQEIEVNSYIESFEHRFIIIVKVK